jgi:nucleotide-binding universal stress UspA family protein
LQRRFERLTKLLYTPKQGPVEALLAVAGDCDLLILGACGVRGVRALGSVGERVAHRAPASVLVVRGKEVATPRDDA